VRGIAVSTAQRFPGAPDYPTIAESGLPGFDASAWDGIFAPAGTPATAVARLNNAIYQALTDPEIVAALRARGALAVPGSPEDLARLVAASSDKWGRVVRASGAKID
jgi:tripartite-type tricarboxylate transporter receptor subunit TctC